MFFLPQGAARRLSTQKKNIEVVESVGAAGKSDFKRVVKYFRSEVKFSMLRWRKFECLDCSFFPFLFSIFFFIFSVCGKASMFVAFVVFSWMN